MRKGHRRTQSATICLNRPLEKDKNMKSALNQQKSKNFPDLHPERITIFDIQTLLKNSEAKIHERVFLIDNLQKPILNIEQGNHFEFGKGVNSKLQNNYTLNMLQIPQEAKSKQSPSIHNDDKISIQDQDTFFTEKPLMETKYSKIDKINQLKSYGIKKNNNANIYPSVGKNSNQNEKKSRHTYTKSTKVITYKKPESANEKKIQPVNRRLIMGVRQEFQTHKKNALSYNLKPSSMVAQKEGLDVFGLLKRKKKNFVL